MTLSISHDFLIKSSDFSSAKEQVERFLEETTLIRYGSVTIDQDKSFSAEQKKFWAALDRGVAENRKTVENLIDELEQCGYSSLQDLFFIKQGFESKILHTVTHMLDGFIGVDSAFYNLIEDSHWLSPSLRREITSHMHEYWLVRVVAGEVREAILHQTPLTTGAKGQ